MQFQMLGHLRKGTRTFNFPLEIGASLATFFEDQVVDTLTLTGKIGKKKQNNFAPVTLSFGVRKKFHMF